MNKRPNFFLPLAALAALLIVNISGAPWQSQPARADKTARMLERLQAKFNEFHAAGKFPGATAGFALADGSSFGLAVGLSDVADKKNMTRNDLMLRGTCRLHPGFASAIRGR